MYNEHESQLEINEFLISDKTGETINVDKSDSDNMRIKNMQNCRILITTQLKTVYLNNLVDCQVVIFPVENSIFGDEITGSVIECCAQQIRIHHTQNTQFRIFVSSSMIIEDR